MIDDDDIAPPAKAPAAPAREAIDPMAMVAEPNTAPASWQERVPDHSWTFKPPVGDSPDLQRVLALSRRPPVETTSMRAAALVELITRRYSNGVAEGAGCRCRTELNRGCITRLRLTQAWALSELGTGSGMLGAIGVGHGKTILDLLSPLALRDCKTAILLVPPGLVTQLVAEYLLLAEHFRVPSLVVHGKDWSSVVAGTPVLHVYPYSRLSRSESTTFLELMQPDAIIADEVHKLRKPDTATTSRVLRYFDDHPATRFCGWSGSITDSSIKDYAHLSRLALRESSPLPHVSVVVDDWARAIDPSDWPAPMGRLEALCDPEETLHSAYHRRLVDTAGVITTTEPAVDCDLAVTAIVAPPIPDIVADALDTLRRDWLRPDGEELVEPLELARCAWQLAQGVYYRWIFPRGEKVSEIEAWKAARKAWRKEMRTRLQSREAHLDSPHLCKLAAIRAWELPESECPKRRGGQAPVWYRESDGLPLWRAETWPAWRAIKDTVNHETEAVRLHPFLAEHAAQWGLANRGVVWYAQAAVGQWVAELSGLPLHGGGPQAGPRIAAERGETSIIASIKSHGTGRDGLQRLFSTQLFIAPPSSATEFEQALGRLHRVGQEAPRVEAHYYNHTPEYLAAFAQAVERAKYVAATTGSRQKILTAELDDD